LKNNILQYFKEQKKTLLLTFLSLLLIISFYGFIEYRSIEGEMLDLLDEQTHALIEAMLTASENTLLVNNYLENKAQDDLISKAMLLKTFLRSRNITSRDLKEFGEISHLYRISIHDSTGKTLLSNLSLAERADEPEPMYFKQILKPVFQNDLDTLVIGLKLSKKKTGYRYGIAIKLNAEQALLINEETTTNMDLRGKIGFGRLLRQTIAENDRIIYALFQTKTEIIAASGTLPQMEAIETNSFLRAAFQDSTYDSRLINSDDRSVFEAVHPLSSNKQKIGLLRIGMSTEPLSSIREHVRFRLMVMGSVLFLTGFFVLIGGFARQKLNLMHNRYQSLETFTGDIINSAGDAILVWDQTEGLKMGNPAFYRLLHLDPEKNLSKDLKLVLPAEMIRIINDPDFSIASREIEIQGQMRHLLVSKTTFSDRNGLNNLVLMMRDLTTQRRSEEQIQRNERLTAMGELASGVAHEIRNPLNAIGTIAQQLSTDFESTEDKENYKNLTRLIYSEVKRMNKTVSDFLEFARPLPVKRSPFDLKNLLAALETQYKAVVRKQAINIEFSSIPQVQVNWDFDQIKQVFINLIDNAIEASSKGQKIMVTVVTLPENFIFIKVSDQGNGISEKNMPNIFNLYFTTKAKGTGIGLSIAQRIIFEHGGTITAANRPEGGAVFDVTLPQT